MGRPLSPSKTLLPSGRWQVRGTRGGKDWKKNFRTEEEADEAMAALAGQVPLPLLPTRLTARELREAEAAHSILTTAGISVLEGARWLLANYKAPASITWERLIAVYQERNKGGGKERRDNVISAVRSFAEFAGAVAGTANRVNVEDWLEKRAGKLAAGTWNHLLNDLNTFCSWHHRRGDLPVNPCVGVDKKKNKRPPPVILTVEAAAALMENLEKHHPEFVPMFVLWLFCGIRPEGETLRLNKSIRSGRRVFYPGGIEVDGKVRGMRIVPLLGPTKEWLAAYPIRDQLLPCEESRAERELTKIRAENGLTINDILRHSGSTAIVWSGLYSFAQAALMLGNSESSLLRHYVGRADQSYSEGIWAIRPKLRAAPALLPTGT